MRTRNMSNLKIGYWTETCSIVLRLLDQRCHAGPGSTSCTKHIPFTPFEGMVGNGRGQVCEIRGWSRRDGRQHGVLNTRFLNFQ